MRKYYAVNKRIIRGNNQPEYQDGDSRGQTAKTGCGYCIERRGKIKEEIKKIDTSIFYLFPTVTKIIAWPGLKKSYPHHYHSG
jgi:hypothetical protein